MNYRWRMYLIQLGLQAFSLLQQSWGKSNKNPDRSRRCLSWKCLTWHWVVTAAKKMLLMVYVTDDWYHHHYTPKLLLMEQLSWKKCRPDFFKLHHHHSEIDEKAQTRLWHLWDGSISRGFPPHLNKARINFEDPPRDFRGAAEEVSISTKVWISCIVPNPPSQLLSVLQFCLFNVSVKHAIPWYIFDCVVL